MARAGQYALPGRTIIAFLAIMTKIGIRHIVGILLDLKAGADRAGDTSWIICRRGALPGKKPMEGAARVG